MLVSEYDVLDKQKPVSFWMLDLNIPQWLLLVLVSLTIIVFTAFILFTAIVTLKKETNGGPCKSNTDCRRDLGLICNNYRCGCAYSHFWSNSYSICERRRMVNRTCFNDSMCDAFASLECQNVSLASGAIQSECQCKASMSWNGYTCVYQGLYNTSCILDTNCDTSRYLFCNLTIQLCRCNSSMFWNGDSKSGTCEYKRTINRFCYPYDDSWCDNTGPLGQGLVCTQYSNPYGSEYGVCQCSTHQFYNGSVSLGNGICVPHRVYNESCTSTSQCDYRINLECSNNLCSCPSGTNYDSSISSSGVMGYCEPAAGYMENCTASLICSSSQNLFCDLSYYGGANMSGICQCNSSWSYWDGTTCAKKLSIGGQCSNNTHCIASDGLFCSNYTQSIGTCDCDKDHFWNYTCILKQWYNTTCTSSYVCDDNRGLQCQGLGGIMFEKCDCYNATYIWDSLYVTNRSYTCIPKLTNGQSTCFGDLECEDFNYLKCNNGICGCVYTDYWDGSRCQAKRNYTDPCSTTTECRDFSPVNLICRYGTTVPRALQCLCNDTSYWEECVQASPNGSNSKRKSIRSKKVIEHPSTSSVASTQSVNGNKKSTKRKLRALDAEDDDLYTLGNLSQIDNLNSDTNCEQIPRYIGQNGILSQTRKLNETSINVEDDFTIKLRSKKSNQKLKTKLSNDSKISESSIGDSLTIIEDVGRIHQEFLKDMSEKDQESLFDSLNITNDRTFETSSSLNKTSLINYNDCIEDISNDGIDPPPPPPPPPPEPLSSTNMSYLSLTT
ncbi:unnamed protein product [Rotaria sp. Silwood2]|nr:unnamed protein product [Rotaria sp. Silwood2]